MKILSIVLLVVVSFSFVGLDSLNTKSNLPNIKRAKVLTITDTTTQLLSKALKDKTNSFTFKANMPIKNLQGNYFMQIVKPDSTINHHLLITR